MSDYEKTHALHRIADNIRDSSPVIRPSAVLAWLGAAFWTAGLPGHGFWDGAIWPWYLGRWTISAIARAAGAAPLDPGREVTKDEWLSEIECGIVAWDMATRIVRNRLAEAEAARNE